MSWIETIRSKPQAVKIRIMWIVSAVVVILLLIVWGISTRFEKGVAPDTLLFRTIGQGVSNVVNSFHKK